MKGFGGVGFSRKIFISFAYILLSFLSNAPVVGFYQVVLCHMASFTTEMA
jgi:hypothetical protein